MKSSFLQMFKMKMKIILNKICENIILFLNLKIY